jgi:DNA-binding PadR family transcriptional regulator
MHSPNALDQLFGRLLPSATQEQVEFSRWRILERVRADVAAGRQPSEQAAVFSTSINYGDYHILRVLEHRDRHGYAIMSEIEQLTEGTTKFGPGTLYTSIERLLKAGLIQESKTRPDLRLNTEPRRHFRLTSLGQRVLADYADRLRASMPHAHITPKVRPI